MSFLKQFMPKPKPAKDLSGQELYKALQALGLFSLTSSFKSPQAAIWPVSVVGHTQVELDITLRLGLVETNQLNAALNLPHKKPKTFFATDIEFTVSPHSQSITEVNLRLVGTDADNDTDKILREFYHYLVFAHNSATYIEDNPGLIDGEGPKPPPPPWVSLEGALDDLAETTKHAADSTQKMADAFLKTAENFEELSSEVFADGFETADLTTTTDNNDPAIVSGPVTSTQGFPDMASTKAYGDEDVPEPKVLKPVKPAKRSRFELLRWRKKDK